MTPTTYMVFDIFRNNAYIEYIKANVSGKIVVDCGSGSGLWTWVALFYGAKHVFSIDLHQPTIDHLNLLFADNDKVTVMKADIFKDALPAGNVYIHEIFSNSLFGEGILNFLKNCQRQNINNLFPSEIKLYSMTEFKTETVSKIYDLSLLQSEIIAFLEYIASKYQQPINFGDYTKHYAHNQYSWGSKTLAWHGPIEELLTVPDIFSGGGEYFSWAAGAGDIEYSPLNGKYSGWRGALEKTLMYNSYLRFLQMDNAEALNYACTKLGVLATSSSA